jgi:hypothetical protein
MGKNEKTSRRDAIRRMAKASMGIGMGLQLMGTFAPSTHAMMSVGHGARFSTIGHVSSTAVGVVTAAVDDKTDCYNVAYSNDGGYANYWRGDC